MNRLLISLIFGTSAALFLVVVPSTGSYPNTYGWRNVSRNSSYGAPARHWGNSSYGVPSGTWRNNSAYWPARYPRSTPYWGNSTHNASHNYFWGYKSPYDRLLYYSRVKKSSSFMRTVTVDLDFPAKYQRPNGTISYIQILDQKPVGRGGYASILRGGVGYKNVTFHFKSQRNHGFDFTVSIYGH